MLEAHVCNVGSYTSSLGMQDGLVSTCASRALREPVSVGDLSREIYVALLDEDVTSDWSKMAAYVHEANHGLGDASQV